MPELPDVTVYLEALEERILNQRLHRVLISSPFLVRTARPPIQEVHGKRVEKLRRIGKRLAIGFEEDYWLVLHLMIAGRLHWKESKPPDAEARRSRPRPRLDLAVFEFDSGILNLTEAGSKKRASLHVVRGAENLRDMDPGGIEVLEASLGEFAGRLTFESHTLKRALTDPHLMSGIGNAYSDEILHAAQLSPATLTTRLSGDEIRRLYETTRTTLLDWTRRLRNEAGGGFPEKVTAFRKGMAVHGRYGQPCPRCGTKVQRIRYADNETNYCPRCQTGGKLLADRSLSRLLKQDWPRTLEELEAMKRR